MNRSTFTLFAALIAAGTVAMFAGCRDGGIMDTQGEAAETASAMTRAISY